MSQLLVTPTEDQLWSKMLQTILIESGHPSIYSFPLRLHKGFDGPFTDRLITLLTQGKKRIRKSRVTAIRCLAVNLYRAAKEDCLTGVLYTMGKRVKQTPRRFRRELFSHDTMRQVVLSAKKLGLVEINRGFKSEGYSSGVPSLLVPTEYIHDLIEYTHQDNIIAQSQIADPLILKQSDNTFVSYTDDIRTNALRQSIVHQNTLRKNTCWQYSIAEGGSHELLACDIACRRIFNGDWKSGGRFYCDAQNLPKQVRSTITANGMPCVELDFKSMHPRLLYHQAGLTAPDDCYHIEGVSRSESKQLGLIATSTQSKTQAIRAVSFHLKKPYKDARALLEVFETRHQQIKRMFYVGAWRRLQHLDSVIANDVLDQLTKNDIPVLPVHDSFIVQQNHQVQLLACMENAYIKRTGQPPVITAA